MRVYFGRALLLAFGILLAATARSQDIKLTGDRVVIPQPPDMSSYYAPGNDTYFLTGDTNVPAPPDDQPQQHPSPEYNNGGTTCPSCAAAAGSGCGCASNFCDSCNDCDGCDICPVCNNCPRRGLILFSELASWQGVGDSANPTGRGSANFGAVGGFNYASKLGSFSDATGIAFQGGASFGVYDWNGRPNDPGALNTTQSQQQTFVTLGLYKRANERSPLSYGVVHDWMFNQGFGAQAVNPTLGQWRGTFAFATSAWNEFGAWGTLRDMGASNTTGNGGTFSTRSINQVDLFWHHKYDFGGDSWLWVGLPQDSRLNSNLGGNLGDFLVGGSVIAPLSDYVSLYGNMQYMHPSQAPGNIGQGEASWYVAFGLQFYLNGAAYSQTVAGNCWLPLMPVANNGNFLVDSWLH